MSFQIELVALLIICSLLDLYEVFDIGLLGILFVDACEHQIISNSNYNWKMIRRVRSP